MRLWLNYKRNTYDFKEYNQIQPLLFIQSINHTDNEEGLIPKKLHIVWIGDIRLRPNECIRSWEELNPDLEIKVWGNKELFELNWYNAQHIESLWKQKCYNGVADIMRYEILYSVGGFAVDADSYCLKTIPNDFFKLTGFSCYESEEIRPGLIAAGYFGSMPETKLLKNIIVSIRNDQKIAMNPAWISVGPGRLTAVHAMTHNSGLTCFPSHYFIQSHYTGQVTIVNKKEQYAEQLWGTTLNRYHYRE